MATPFGGDLGLTLGLAHLSLNLGGKVSGMEAVMAKGGTGASG